MLYHNMFKKYYQEADPEGGSPAGGEPATTYTQEQVDEMVGGLKNKVDELLGEKKTAAQRAKEAEAEATRVAQEAAKKNGKLEEFETSLRSEFDKERNTYKTQLESLTSRVTSAEKKAVLGSMSGDFITPESLELVSQLVKTTVDNDNIKTEFTDFAGNVITTDPAIFKQWMAKHPAISHLMKADGASGGGAGGSNNGNGVTKTMSRNNFDKLNPSAKADFMKQGGALTD